MPTALEALGPALNSAAVERLGDTITYTPAGGSAVEIVAFVDFEEIETPGGPGAIGQQITVEAFYAQIPVRPSDGARVVLPERTGQTFKPVNVRVNETGDGWRFGVKQV